MKITIKNADNPEEVFYEIDAMEEANKEEEDAIVAALESFLETEIVKLEVNLKPGTNFQEFDIDEIRPEETESVIYHVRKKIQL